MARADGLEDCFERGAEAREAGRKLADNPYGLDTDEHREWAAGWSATFDLDEDPDAASTRIAPGDTDMEADPARPRKP